MTDQDLDKSYSALRAALSALGPDKASLFLAMLSLSLISRAPDATAVQALIEQAQAHATFS